MRALVEMHTEVEGLHASAPQALPFAPSMHARAFLLRRQQDNLLVYSVGDLEAEAPAIEDLGGISRQYLNHRHEAAFLADDVEAPLFLHENEYDAVDTRARVPWTFSRGHVLDGDFQVIPTPGHTTGATAYLWDSGRHRFLFTGDTIHLREGEWVAAVLDSSDRGPYVESLEQIRELDFDVLVPWIASAGEPYHAVTSRADTRRRIDAILERVRSGGSW